MEKKLHLKIFNLCRESKLLISMQKHFIYRLWFVISPHRNVLINYPIKCNLLNCETLKEKNPVSYLILS